jgi:hypothetical protein
MTDFGFILLRHVNDEITSNYWTQCYDSIRKYYPENKILIIDDNSNYEFIKYKKLYKTLIINSEYPKRGELLPYYYYLQNKLFDTAVIIHDSVFINAYVDLSVDEYKILWHFDHFWDRLEDERKIISIFGDPELNLFYENKDLWVGCFGGMSIITHDYLSDINNKYDISKLLDCILNRDDRCCFERVIACLLQKNKKTDSLFGNIHSYCIFGEIIFDNIENYKHLPFIKFWSGFWSVR